MSKEDIEAKAKKNKYLVQILQTSQQRNRTLEMKSTLIIWVVFLIIQKICRVDKML
jgi:hypothetical protein